MTYNKSELMRKAWNLYNNREKLCNQRFGIFAFSDALRKTWADAKYAAKVAAQKAEFANAIKYEKGSFVNVKALTAGDKIKVAPPGCASLFKNVTIATIEETAGFNGLRATFTNGDTTVFATYDTVERFAA
ncbi:MAG: hypothetical protein FWB96_01495 [Defluviitaleaceae bacterium]|nr:hypothetical protein [Defluviitaleaceae bacterium]MCL2261632.1 hypothetical protein [Defluviitaleaceae bacterium]